MKKEFLKSKEVKLVGDGYLVNQEGTPINNENFVDAQKMAEYVVAFAEVAKTKDFKGKTADDIVDVKSEVLSKLSKKDEVKYLETPAKPKTPTTSKLAEEALKFIEHDEEKTKVDKVNTYLNRFNSIYEFENFGLFFDDSEIVKLDKIYTMSEIIEAVNTTIDLL